MRGKFSASDTYPYNILGQVESSAYPDETLTAAVLRTAVDEFLAGKWADTSSSFSIATSAPFVRTELCDCIEAEASKCRARNVEFVLLDQERLSEFLKDHPDLVDDFFGRDWVNSFNGPEAAATLSKRRLTKEQHSSARRKLRALYSTHFSVVDFGLPIPAGLCRPSSSELLLHVRYIEPEVESISTFADASPDSISAQVGGSSESASKNTSNFSPRGFRIREQRQTHKLFEWLANTDKAVLLAGPGLGKSSTLRFIALDLLDNEPRCHLLAEKWAGYLPIFLPFAMLTRLVSEREVISMTDFVRGWMHKLNASQETIELVNEALEDERLLLILDGLDEWSDTTAASTALATILNFSELRQLPIIASSRPQGCERLGGLPGSWSQAHILPLDDDRQAAFARLWFHHLHSANVKDCSTEQIEAASTRDAESFLEEIQSDAALSTLAGTPLLLSTLIYLRLQGRVLPRSKFAALDEFVKILLIEQPQRRSRGSLQGTGLGPTNVRYLERGVETLAFRIHEEPGIDSISPDAARQCLVCLYEGPSFGKSPSEAVELADLLVDRATHEIGLLIQRAEGQIGFIHASFREHLAARELSRRPIEDLRRIFAERFSSTHWHEIFLDLLHSLSRTDEVDSLLCLVKGFPPSALKEPHYHIFLAQAVFSGANCSASLATEIANNIFRIIEASAWMPLRHSLIEIVVGGLDSEMLCGPVEERLNRWFPCRHKYSGIVIRKLAEKPRKNTGQLLLQALFNVPSEAKDIAEAIGAGAKDWPELIYPLLEIVHAPAEPELTASALNAIANGWPETACLGDLLLEASNHHDRELRATALIQRTRRGDRSDEVKLGLSALCSHEKRIYNFEDEIINALILGWKTDPGLRSIALKAAVGKVMPSEWDDNIGLRFLIRAYPGDDEVAQIIAARIRDKKYLGTVFNHWKDWEGSMQGFYGHPAIRPAVEFWLEKSERLHDGCAIAHLVALGRSPKCREFLLERLKAGDVFPGWMVKAYLDIADGGDQEFRTVINPILADEKRSDQLASYFPELVGSQNECEDRLLSVLSRADGFDASRALEGLSKLKLATSARFQEIVLKRLGEDPDGTFWWAAKEQLMSLLPQNDQVRSRAKAELLDDDGSWSTVASYYNGDDEIRPLLESVLFALHRDLVPELMRAVGRYAMRGHLGARKILANFRFEVNPEARTVASAFFHASNRRSGVDLKPLIDELAIEMFRTGRDYEVRRQACLVAYIALRKVDALAAELNNQKKQSHFSSHGHSTRNWEFINIIVSRWKLLHESFGDKVWQLFSDWDIFVSEIARSEDKALLASIPETMRETALNQYEIDIDVFNALAVLEPQEQFRERCLKLFRSFVHDTNRHSISWGHNTMQVLIAAGHFLASRFSGDEHICAELEDLARSCVENTGPVIALCRGWPQSNYLKKVGDLRETANQSFSQAAVAWLTNVSATPEQFCSYLCSLPQTLQRSGFWDFPSEILRAAKNRLRTDPVACECLFQALKASNDNDIVASVAQLLGKTTNDRRRLTAWADEKLATVSAVGQIPTSGYDITNGRHRPIQFCLKDACLTN